MIDPAEPSASPLRLHEVAHRLGVDALTVLLWVTRGDLKAIDTREPGRAPRWRIPESALTTLLERRGGRHGPEIVRLRRELAGLHEQRGVLMQELQEIEQAG